MGKTDSLGYLGTSATINGVTYKSNRITYSSSNPSLLSIDNNTGEITVKAGNATGTYSVKISILVGGNVVGTKTIDVTVTKMQTIDLPAYNNNDCVDIGSGEKGDGWANIGNDSDNEAYNDQILLLNCATTCSGNVNTIIDNIISACKGTGKYDNTALDTAAVKAKELYKKALEELFKNRAGKKSSNTVNVGGYKAYTTTYHYQSSTGGTSPKSQSVSNGYIGLTLQISTNKNDTYKCQVNTTCVKDIIQIFYRQALGL